jgi:hypothetical protein
VVQPAVVVAQAEGFPEQGKYNASRGLAFENIIRFFNNQKNDSLNNHLPGFQACQ